MTASVMCRVKGLTALVLATCALAACAQTPPPAADATADRPPMPAIPAGDPPVLPVGATAADVRTWADRFINAEGFAEAASDAARITYFRPDSVTHVATGQIQAVFRSELVQPRFADGHWLRSIVKTMLVDCAGLRYRELELHGFARSNLQAPVPDITPPTRWMGPFAPESSAGAGLVVACRHAGIASGSATGSAESVTEAPQSAN